MSGIYYLIIMAFTNVSLHTVLTWNWINLGIVVELLADRITQKIIDGGSSINFSERCKEIMP